VSQRSHLTPGRRGVFRDAARWTTTHAADRRGPPTLPTVKAGGGVGVHHPWSSPSDFNIIARCLLYNFFTKSISAMLPMPIRRLSPMF